MVDVKQFYIRHRHIAVTLIQLYHLIFFFQGIVIRFTAGCGTTHQKGNVVLPGNHHGYISGIITRCRLKLLKAAVVLFIHNDQPRVLKWDKYG